ncbi:hypothetical protein R4282_13645 [Rhodococcus oxybenzonivorans]|uniref:hypothetical protein n=1 Tax=Rhodococcus oxybenzonivorans TaxID=1990687 RepID=UPI002954E34D|nr:hypothetical protein [Rhodococcus oxybenzonivorans]MDV7354050.1 hypothetical protein [Rhodococcus oxybenzonivorans]
MNVVQLNTGGYVAALLSLDFVDGAFRGDAVERIHRGEVDEWDFALARTGLFGNRAVAEAVQSWRDDPRSLLDALLTDADEVLRKRYDVAWQALDRVATVGSAAYA